MNKRIYVDARIGHIHVHGCKMSCGCIRLALFGSAIAFGVLCACAGDSVWTGSANDGKWTTADNWDGGLPSSAGTAIIARDAGAPYAVSLDAGVPQQVVSNLYVGGSAASLTVAGDLKLDGGRFALTNAATISVEPGGSVTIDQLSQSAASNRSDEFVRIVGGSTLNLSGDFTLTNAAGRFSIGDDSYAVTSKIIQTGGTFSFRQNQSHNGIWLWRGGRIEVSGGVVDWTASPATGSPINMRGGGFEFSGDSEVLAGGNFGFGSGYTLFRGSSTLRTTSRAQINTNADNIPALVEIIENASIQAHDNSTMLIVGTSKRSQATLVMRSAVNSNIGGALHCGRSDGTSSCGRCEIQSAYNKVGSYGLQLGLGDSNLTATESPTGTVDVVGGVLDVDAQAWAWGTGNLYGIVIGSGIRRATNRTTARYNGFFTLSGDGVVTNRYGWFAVGAGPAYGEYRQTGGLFNHAAAQAVCVGQFGAEGHVDISGGTMMLNGPLYIGGAKASEIDRATTDSKVPLDEHGGTGTFSVSNATVALLKDAFIGLDGNGVMTIGPGANVTGASLYVTNDWAGATSTLRFVLGAETAGKVSLSGKLQVCDVGRVIVDTSAFSANTRLTLLEAADIEGLQPEDVQLVDAGGRSFKVTVTDTAIKVSRASGLAIIVR